MNLATEPPPALPRAPLSRGRGDGVTRLARRTQRGQGGRRLLVLSLIAVAVAVGVVAGSLSATAARSDREFMVADQLGLADLLVLRHGTDDGFLTTRAELTDAQRRWLDEHPFDAEATLGRELQDPEVVEVPLDDALALLPDGARVLRYEQNNAAGYGAGSDQVAVTNLDVADPLATETYDIGDRSVSLTGDEALVSASMLARLGARIGDTLEVPDVGTVELVGTATRAASRSQPLLVVAPGRDLGHVGIQERARVDLPEGVAAPDVADRVRAGVQGVRQSSLDGRSNVDVWVQAPEVLTREQAGTSSEDPMAVATIVGMVVTGFAVTVAAMVAACAFAVGVRRRLRQVGMLGAVGATPPQLGRLVRREGLVIGSSGAVLGAVLGLLLALAGQPLLERALDRDVTLLLPLTAVVPPVLLGCLAAMGAAYWPARTAARVPVTAALAGRVPAGRVPRWMPVASLVLVGVGVVLFSDVVAFHAERSEGVYVLEALAAGLLSTIGAAGLGLPVLALGGRLADRLPMLGRLALRDSARQRSRSGAAIAALVPVLALPVAAMVVTTADVPPDAAWQSTLAYREPSPSPFARVVGPTVEFRDVPPSDEVVQQAGELLPATGRTAAAVQLGEPSRPGAVTVAWGVPGLDIGSDAAGYDHLPQELLHLATPALLDLLGLPADAVAQGTVLFLPRGGFIRQFPQPGQPVEVIRRAQTEASDEDPSEGGRPAVVPADQLVADVAAEASTAPGVVALVSPATADALGLVEVGRATVLELRRPPTPAESLEAWSIQPPGGWVELRPSAAFIATPLGRVLVAAAIALALVVVVSVVAGMTAALAATESDADLRKVVALGAEPRLRRRFHGVQAWWHALVAGVLGTVLGIVVGLVVIDRLGTVLDPRVWLAAAGWVAVLPVSVGLVIALFVRSSPVEAPRRRMA